VGIKSNKIIVASAIIGLWAIYGPYTIFIYLLLPFPVGYPSYYPAGTRVINYPDTAALLTINSTSYCCF